MHGMTENFLHANGFRPSHKDSDTLTRQNLTALGMADLDVRLATDEDVAAAKREVEVGAIGEWYRCRLNSGQGEVVIVVNNDELLGVVVQFLKA